MVLSGRIGVAVEGEDPPRPAHPSVSAWLTGWPTVPVCGSLIPGAELEGGAGEVLPLVPDFGVAVHGENVTAWTAPQAEEDLKCGSTNGGLLVCVGSDLGSG